MLLFRNSHHLFAANDTEQNTPSGGSSVSNDSPRTNPRGWTHTDWTPGCRSANGARKCLIIREFAAIVGATDIPARLTSGP